MRAIWTILIAAAVIGAAPEARAQPEVVDGLRAVVHDSIVTIGEVLNMSRPAEEELARTYFLRPEALQLKIAEVRNESLGELLKRQLVLHDFEATLAEPERRAVVEKLIAKDVDQQIADEIRLHYGGNRMSFIQTLHAEGVTLERHRQKLRDGLIISWLRQKNISSEIIASPHRIEVYYLAHREEFKLQDEVRLRMIVLPCADHSRVAQTRERAQEIVRKLNEGATFVEMATLYSEGSQRAQGGDLGWWEMPGGTNATAGPRQTLSKHLADTASSLQAGQHSGVLSRSAGSDFWVCQYGSNAPILARHYTVDAALNREILAEERRLEDASALTNLPPPMEFYIMLVEDKRSARFKTLAEVRDRIEKDLVAQEQSRLEKQWIDRLRKKTFVRIL